MAKTTNIESHFVPSTPVKNTIIISDVISIEDAGDSIMANLREYRRRRRILSEIDHDVISVEDAGDSITMNLYCFTPNNQKSKLIDLTVCKQLAPEYEKAAAELSSHVPPVVLAKIDASEETNKEFATQFQVQGFPTIKIFGNRGKAVQEYNGPCEADAFTLGVSITRSKAAQTSIWTCR
ncbi:hypothetical protein Bca4012_026470 [Brassica carinata]